MPDSERLLEFANQLFTTHTGKALSKVLRLLLAEALITGAKSKSYSQIGAETGYSGAYLGTVAARDLWNVFSDIFVTKVTRRNIGVLLLQHFNASNVGLSSTPVTSLENGALVEGMAESNAEDIATPTADDATSPQQRSSSVPWILVVDDQPHNLELLTHMLKNEEYQVWSAQSGAEALKKVGVLLPDLILLDVNMPGMNGYEVCRQLKADPRTQLIPVIFVSALDESWDKVQAFSVGGTDYITKPFDTIEAFVRIDHQIQIGAARAQLSSLGDQNPGEESSQLGATLQDSSVDKQLAGKASIMVVDDDAKNLSLIAHLLKEEGYAVWQASTGTEALRFAPKVMPDLVLLDINLPDMSGYAVCHQLRANDQIKRIPVIFVSALDEAWDKVKGFAVGGNDYVTKPLQILELHCRIRNQLRLQQLRLQLTRIRATEDPI
ncbi:MAG: response regulator [Cyanobacteria bacterium P01_A01_bin.123]